MAAQLQESYASLEQKVEERTRELGREGRQLSSPASINRNSSPT